MKANFKKASVFALAMALVLLMSLSVIPMVSAEEAAATTDTYYEIEQNYNGALAVETIGAMNISLSGDIKLMIGYEKDSLSDAHSYIKIKIESANGKKDKSKTVKLSDLKEEDGLYWVEIEVPAAQQTDLVEFKWFDANHQAGKSRKYSVRYYAEKIMGMANKEIDIPAGVTQETVANMDQTVKGMLNYGAVSQIAHNYNTDKLANKGLYTDETNPLENMLVEHLYDAKANTEIDTSKSVFQGVQVYLEGSLRIRIYTNAPEGTAVTIDGESFTTSAEGDYSYVGIYNIPANMYDHQFEIVVNGETLHYSVLGYCLDTLNDYKSEDDQKNIAKALYQYYTWTANYAREDYVPGPKDETTGASVCEHERYYLSGVNVVCSDCGENISETTRVSLTPTAPSFEISESGTEVTFILSVVGSVDLKALSVTPVAEGLTLEATSIEILDPHKDNASGTVALNILLDAETAITENTQLAQITYNVKAADAGSYKINLTVNEAINDDNEDVSDFIVPVTAVLEAVKVCNCEEYDGYQIDATKGTHRWYCNDCKQTGAWEAHAASNVWTPVIEAEGGKVTGELFEANKCACGYTVETRNVYYTNNTDSVRVNRTIINPYTANKAQTADIAGITTSGYKTMVLTSENFIWHEISDDKTVVEGSTTPLTFHDTDYFMIWGWFAVNGGVDRYVVKITAEDGTESEWKTLSGTPGSTDPEATTGIGGAINGNANFTDDGAHTNCNYQSGLQYNDFEAYANQTVKLTFGAVPANNPGTTENPNVLITCVVENLSVECTHLADNVASIEATDVPTVFNATCACGETYTTSDINDEVLKMFNADEIVHRGAGQGGSNYSITKMTENGLDFARFELLNDKTTGSEYLYHFANDNTNNATNLTYGVSDVFMIVYRANEAYPGSLVLYANQGSWKYKSCVINDNGEWHVALYDMSTLYDDTLGYLNIMRLDIFDDAIISAGATFDIAYAGFFKDANHAMANYKTAIDKHDAIGAAANFFVSMDAFYVDGEGYNAETNKTPDNMTVSSTGAVEHKPIKIDLTGTTIATVDSSLNYCGWIVTPSGAEGLYYTITDEEGNVSERRFYVKPGEIAASNRIVTATTSLMYGDGRLVGAAYQSTTAKFDLSGYAGETVTIDVILVNNWGQEATIMQITNVEVLTCTHDNVVDVPNTYPTDTQPGYYAHKVCDTCGKVWDTEGNELDAAPVSAEKLNPTVNKYWGYEDMKGWDITEGEGSTATVITMPSEDRSYVRFSRGGTTTDCFALFMSGNTQVTGQYLVIKYRTDSSTTGECWANTTANGHSGGKANFSMTFDHDGEWHLEVIDLSAKIPSYVKAAEDGTYTIQWARIDLMNNTLSEGYFDIGYMAFTDDLSKIQSIMLEEDADYCEHSFTSKKEWNPTEKVYISTCYVCGETFKESAIHTAEPIISGAAGITGTQTSDGTMKYSTTLDANTDHYVHIYTNGTTVTGKYMIIKYKAYDSAGASTLSLRSYFAGSATSENGVAIGNGDGNVSNSGAFIADGEWHYQIVWPTDANTQFGANEDGTYTWKYLRIGFNASVNGQEAYVEIDSIAFVDNLYAANVYMYGDEAVCSHSSLEYTWSSEDKLYSGGTCSDCGEIITKDMIYKTEANTATGAGSKSNYLTVTTGTDADGETYVRYTATGTVDSDSYFFPLKGNTNVTGNYMVIKYRASNNGTNLSMGTTYASSAASGQNAGATGSSNNYWVSNKTLYADGDWHYVIVTTNETANASFTKNNDGTYSWGYIRTVISNWSALDGSYYLDIGEIAFADNVEAAVNYAAKNDATILENLRYVANLDNSNVTLDNVSFMGAAKRGNNAPIVLDMSQKVLTTPTSLKIGGWVCVDGGVKAYKMRVTSVDGKAVDNPELVTFVTPGNRTDIYTAFKTSYTEDCAIGAGMNKTAVNLTAWAGHTVTFEIVAITNYGAEIVAVRCTDVTVPAAE